MPGKCLTEFIGTFMLALTILLVVITPGDLGAFAPLAIGMVLTTLVYSGGPISGAHYNPAVTVAFMLAGRFERSQVGPYITTQLLAGLSAAGVAMLIDGRAEVPIVPSIPEALIAEGIFTFALCWTIFQVTGAHVKGNAWFGLSIGLVVGAGAYAVGSVSGAAFNPAVWLALATAGKIAWSTWWIYFVAQGAGVVAAVAAQRVLDGTDTS